MTIIRDNQKSFADSVPVVVVGAGACGLTAALAAVDGGADVLVLERDERPGGSTGMSIGAVCAAGTAEQRAHGIEDSTAAFVEDVLAKTEGRADRALTELIGRESGPAVDWLAEQHAVPLQLDFAWTGLGHSRPRLHAPPGRTGEELLGRLSTAAERSGVALVTEALVTDLYADASDRVLGVRIARPDGSHEELGCSAVVLATCGFGGNHSMIAKHIPAMANARYFGHEGNRGDGILWGAALGGEAADMSAYQGLGTLADPQSIIVPHTLMIDGGVLVNVRGQRFTHELANISGMCIPVLAQPEGRAWVLFDQQRLTASLGHSIELQQLKQLGAVKSAAHLPALESQMGVAAGSLTQTLAQVAASKAAGTVDSLGRSFAKLDALAPPYCAIRVTGALFHTQGGLRVDSEARVLRADGTALPNLFAGGGTARSISGPDVTGYLPAMGLCMAITLGRIAGRAAARQVR
ncbi:MAG: FAD-dependent oxidoreductase [Steroidobacteraceae bacterium]